MNRLTLVTGATGFVGQAVVGRLLHNTPSGRVAAAVRQRGAMGTSRVEEHVIADLSARTDWSHALDGVDTVIHCAARVHVMRDHAADPLDQFRRVNVQGTLQLARQAAAMGVRRFVFLSSVKVNGEATLPACPFTPDDLPAPQDAYGVSKHEAELGLRQLAHDTGLEVVIIRPPLVYGPGVKANFASMMRWLGHGVPLPLGAIDNRRSLVALDNLVDLVHLCVMHPAAAQQTFLVSDDDDVSTTRLLRCMGAALGRPARLIPVPSVVLERLARLIGQRAVARRLCDSLQVDITKTRDLLDWRPPLTLIQGLRKAAGGMS